MRLSGKIIFAAMAILGVSLAASCEKEGTTYDRQEESIESLVKTLTSANDTAVVRYRKGSTIVTTVPGQGDSLSSKGSVTLYYAGHYLNSGALNAGNLFATNLKDYATSAGWNLSDTTVFSARTIRLGEDEIVEGLLNGLTGAKAGEERYVMFNGKHGFGDKGPRIIPKNSALAYRLWIIEVSND